MATVNAARCKPDLKPFYQRRRDEKGKPAKVALTAVMRKMLCTLNRFAADPNFSLVYQHRARHMPRRGQQLASQHASGGFCSGAEPDRIY